LIPEWLKEPKKNPFSSEEKKQALNAILSLILYVKHEAFDEEWEYRLCIPFDGVGYEIGIRKRKGDVVDYLRFPVPNIKKALKKVIIGPQKNQSITQSILEGYLKKKGFNAKVVESDIPYLGKS